MHFILFFLIALPAIASQPGGCPGRHRHNSTACPKALACEGTEAVAKNSVQNVSRHQIDPKPIQAGLSVTELVDGSFLSYNGGRLREAVQIFSKKILNDETTIGMTLSGALTPAGLGQSSLVPLIQAGYVDWFVSTGANLYHDTHYALGQELFQSHPDRLNDLYLRDNDIIRIYDIVFPYQNLLDTDSFYRTLLQKEAFQKTMGSAEFHFLVGKYLYEFESKVLKREPKSLLANAWKFGVPIYTSSPGDSSIGMNVAANALQGHKLQFDPNIDVNQTAAIIYEAKKKGSSAVVIWGGGSPKNFILQTEPHIQEVLGLDESGHDYFIQFTDARVDTGGLSGATASEAMTWGKVDPEQLPNAVTAYVDTTIAMPVFTAYALESGARREPKRLMGRLNALYEDLRREYLSRQK